MMLFQFGLFLSEILSVQSTQDWMSDSFTFEVVMLSLLTYTHYSAHRLSPLSCNTESRTAFILKFLKSAYPPLLTLFNSDLLGVKSLRVNIDQTEPDIRT